MFDKYKHVCNMNTVNILLHYCFPFGKKCHKELDKYMLNEKAATFIKLCAWKRTFNLQKRREEKDRVCMERLVYCISILLFIPVLYDKTNTFKLEFAKW